MERKIHFQVKFPWLCKYGMKCGVLRIFMNTFEKGLYMSLKGIYEDENRDFTLHILTLTKINMCKICLL